MCTTALVYMATFLMPIYCTIYEYNWIKNDRMRHIPYYNPYRYEILLWTSHSDHRILKPFTICSNVNSSTKICHTDVDRIRTETAKTVQRNATHSPCNAHPF